MIKVSDLVARKLAEHGIKHVFMITGGGAMHLNMSLGRCEKLVCVYNHHEQAGAMAAESYARLGGKMAAVCVTSGPGGTNAITGVIGAWFDSIPMLVISGQVKSETTVASTGLELRQLGDQEFDIASVAKSFTKYSVMVTNPLETAYHLDKACHLAVAGRPGPVWLDIPLDVQGAMVDEAKLVAYKPDVAAAAPRLQAGAAAEIVKRIANAKRPVLLAGTGIRISGAYDDFLKTVGLLNIPVVTAWNAHDVLPDEHPLYFGRPGTVGDRPGNFIFQNADLVLSLGCRLNIRQIGYDWKTVAREAFKIIVDIDPLELKKPTIKPDMAVCCDVAELLRAINALAGQQPRKEDWINWCAERRRRYPVVKPEYWNSAAQVNPYCFIEALGRGLAENEIVVTGNGSAGVCTAQALKIKKGLRLYSNSGCASMGYDLPAAIGACAASGRRVVCVTGDGSLQMNIQELQTIAHNKLPVKIFVLNNAGYHSIRQTQCNFFEGGLVGCGPDSGVGFPDLGKIASAYGLEFERCAEHSALDAKIAAVLASAGPALCEIVTTPEQAFEPRSASRRLPDGRIVSKPLEDMAPFLERNEFLENMIIKPVDEGY